MRGVAVRIPAVARRADALMAAGIDAWTRLRGRTPQAQYSFLITKYDPRIVPARFDLCRANLKSVGGEQDFRPLSQVFLTTPQGVCSPAETYGRRATLAT